MRSFVATLTRALVGPTGSLARCASHGPVHMPSTESVLPRDSSSARTRQEKESRMRRTTSVWGASVSSSSSVASEESQTAKLRRAVRSGSRSITLLLAWSAAVISGSNICTTLGWGCDSEILLHLGITNRTEQADLLLLSRSRSLLNRFYNSLIRGLRVVGGIEQQRFAWIREECRK